MKDKKFVYADNAATTRVSKEVVETMTPYFTENYGNPSSIYTFARTAKHAIERAREQTAAAIGAKDGEIYFTSCGTESDNWAIIGAARTSLKKGKKHIISTNVEHHAVLHTLNSLEKQGFEVEYLPVDQDGLITPEQISNAIREDTALVTVMYANNEIGTIFPVTEIGEICRNKNVLFHTDAVQAVGNVRIDVCAQNIDMLSMSGHKIHAPKGIGCLYIRKGVVIDNLMHGGGQEKRKRPGTENVPYIAGFGTAIAKAAENIEQKAAYTSKLRDTLAEGILKSIPKVRINGTMDSRLCGNLNVSFEGIEGEAILLRLDAKGICASSGSACTSGSLDPSHVLLAMGLPHELAHGSLRLTLNDENTMNDVEYILDILPSVIQQLRDMSPLWAK